MVQSHYARTSSNPKHQQEQYGHGLSGTMGFFTVQMKNTSQQHK
jgi:hypothetical protein